MIISTKVKIRGAGVLAAIVNLSRRLVGLQHQAEFVRRGLNWSLDLGEGIDFSIYLLGAFEPKTIAAYRRILKPGDIAIDVGANIGAHTLPLAEAVGITGQVLAAEPTSEIYLKLKENLRLNPRLEDRVQAFQVMLMASDDVELPNEIYARWPLKESTGAHPLHLGVAVSTEGATILSLDSLVTRNNIKRVDLIKLDVDGYESDVLLGATNTIRKDKPVIIFEYSPYTSKERNIDPNIMIDFFNSMNYAFFDLSGRPFQGSEGNLPTIKPGAGINILAQSRAPRPATNR